MSIILNEKTARRKSGTSGYFFFTEEWCLEVFNQTCQYNTWSLSSQHTRCSKIHHLYSGFCLLWWLASKAAFIDIPHLLLNKTRTENGCVLAYLPPVPRTQTQTNTHLCEPHVRPILTLCPHLDGKAHVNSTLPGLKLFPSCSPAPSPSPSVCPFHSFLTLLCQNTIPIQTLFSLSHCTLLSKWPWPVWE